MDVQTLGNILVSQLTGLVSGKAVTAEVVADTLRDLGAKADDLKAYLETVSTALATAMGSQTEPNGAPSVE